MYGQNCSTPCGDCANGQQCVVFNGQCPNGCEPGLQPPMCVTGGFLRLAIITTDTATIVVIFLSSTSLSLLPSSRFAVEVLLLVCYLSGDGEDEDEIIDESE